MIAVCRIRTQPDYRRDAFVHGLQAVGYRLVDAAKPSGPEDLLVIWNRYGAMHQAAHSWEAGGGTVLVCENGYIGKDKEGRQYYAISAHGHNGSGWWPVGTEKRWPALGIEIRQWQPVSDEAHVLVCGQRGIGSPTMASPNGWHDIAARRLRARTSRPVRVRLHPGRHEPKTALGADLSGAFACAIWSSGSGVKALVDGYRVFYDAPHWICAPAADRLGDYSEDSLVRDRETALERMAHAQWSVAEIESAEPFARFRAEINQRQAA